MQPCPIIRTLEINNYVQRPASGFVEALSTARQLAQQPIKYMLIDPFDKSITELQLTAAEVTGCSGVGHWVYVHPAESEMQRVVQTTHIISRALTENKDTGAYTAVIGTVLFWAKHC